MVADGRYLDRTQSRQRAYFDLLTRTRQSDDKLKKYPCLGRRVVSRWMVCIEREALIRPIWEQVDEPSLADQRLGSEQQHLRDAGACQTRVEERARIIHRKPSIRFDNKLFALAMKLPRIRLSCFRVPEFEAPVYATSQLLRLRWPSPASEV